MIIYVFLIKNFAQLKNIFKKIYNKEWFVNYKYDTFELGLINSYLYKNIYT